MQDEPADLTRQQIAETLRRHWRIETEAIEYAPVGFGSYHWRVLDTQGSRWFITADRTSNMLGFGLDAAGNEAGLRAAYDTAAGLRDAGLDFVVAPVASVEGNRLSHPATDWCLAVFAHIRGNACGSGTWDSASDQTNAAALIGRLHSTPPLSATQRWSGALPNRRHLERALAELDEPWTTGPYAEQTHSALAEAQTTLETQLARYDRLTREVMAMPEPWVTTHGEPHQANFIKAPDGELHLIDWDTVRIAPRERDLWIVLEENEDALSAYQTSAGPYRPRPEAMALFDLSWQLTDLCIYVRRFRALHGHGADDAKSWRGIPATLARLDALPSP